LPRVDHDDTGPFKILRVACHDGHVVDQGGCGDQRVGFIAPVKNIQVGARGRDRFVNWYDAICEFRTHAAVEPGSEWGALRGIPALHSKHTALKFKDRND